MENEIRCSIKIEDRAEGVRLVGVLMPYGTEGARQARGIRDREFVLGCEGNCR